MADITAIAIRYADEVWNAQNLDAADDLFTADHVYHDALLPDLPKGPEGVRQRRGVYLAAIPDARVTLHRILTQGEYVAADWTYTGTNTGEIMGMPPTGRDGLDRGLALLPVRGRPHRRDLDVSGQSRAAPAARARDDRTGPVGLEGAQPAVIARATSSRSAPSASGSGSSPVRVRSRRPTQATRMPTARAPRRSHQWAATIVASAGSAPMAARPCR